jgi:hypothetical protein
MRSFVRRYPWTVAFTILFVAMIAGFGRVQNISEGQQEDRNARREESIARDQQFCRAIPTVSVAGAQALINVVLAQNRSEGASASEIRRIKTQGRLYVAEARRLALEQLPECPKILASQAP